MKISQLNFGAPAAERDISVGLSEYFVESDAFMRVRERRKTIVLGNRGSGKSAIFKVLADREKKIGTLVLELSPEDYSYEMLQTTLKKEDEGSWAKYGAYSSAWKYLIYVLVMKSLCKGDRKVRGGDAGKVGAYLRDHHQGAQGGAISVLISYLKRMEGIKIGQYEASIKTRELAKLYKLEEIDYLLPGLKSMLEKRRVIVLIDELDRGWDSSEDARAFVAGLFQAAISINELTPQLTVYVSLRRELYDSIPALYDDAQKYRDIIETIEWDETELKKVVANRIRFSVPELEKRDDDACWNTVFAETLQYRRSKSFNYMIDRTLYRPREIVQFCVDCIETLKGADSGPIDYDTLSRAEMRYSEERTKDIAAEFRFQFPGLLSVFEVFRGRVYTMEREDLELLCLGMTTAEIVTDEHARRWIDNQDPELVIDALWKVGFIKGYAVGGLKARRRSGSAYIGQHQIAHLNLRNIARFQVHPMFRAYLSMKEPRGDGNDT